jgi:hypothetical protein
MKFSFQQYSQDKGMGECVAYGIFEDENEYGYVLRASHCSSAQHNLLCISTDKYRKNILVRFQLSSVNNQELHS